jgi:hypothetical protein
MQHAAPAATQMDGVVTDSAKINKEIFSQKTFACVIDASMPSKVLLSMEIHVMVRDQGSV